MLGIRERLRDSGHMRASTLDAVIGALDDAAALAAELGYSSSDIDHAAHYILLHVERHSDFAAWGRRRIAGADFIEVAAKRRRLEAETEPFRGGACLTSVDVSQRVRWPTGFAQRVVEADDTSARAKIERRERDKHAHALGEIIAEACRPLATIASTTLDPDALLRSAIRRGRPATVRLRLRAWAKVRMWMSNVYGVPWPPGISAIIDYRLPLRWPRR